MGKFLDECKDKYSENVNEQYKELFGKIKETILEAIDNKQKECIVKLDYNEKSEDVLIIIQDWLNNEGFQTGRLYKDYDQLAYTMSNYEYTIFMKRIKYMNKCSSERLYLEGIKVSGWAK